MPSQAKPNPPPLPPGVRPAFRTAIVCTVLFAGTMLLFSRAVGYGFLNYDDPAYVSENAHVMAGLTWKSVAWAFAGLADYWHPLSWLSHMTDWELYGGNASGHHLTSIIWHAANAVLVFLVFRRLTGSFWTSAFCAALFAWHPLRVESVDWITERKDVMSGFFFLLTLWSYAAYSARKRDGTKATGLYLATLGLFACGLMSKPMLVSVPVVLLLLDFWPLRRAELPGAWRLWRGLLVEKLPFFGLSAVVSVVTVLMQARKGGFVLEVPLVARMGNAVVSVARYLGKFFWPADLVVCYPHPGSWPWAAVAAAAALVALITIVAWSRRRTEPWFLAGWGWFLVMLAPVIGIVQAGFQAMADRYTYLPILGWQLACLCSLQGLGSRPARRALAGVIGAAVLAILVAVTWRQEAYWESSKALFEHAIAVNDQNPVAQGFLGYTLAAEGRNEEAEAHCRKALEIDPNVESARYTLARLLERRGDTSGAVENYETLLHADPGSYAGQYELGQLLLRLGRINEAVPHLKAAAAMNSNLAATDLSLGAAELQKGKLDRALVYFQTAAIAAPADAMGHFWLGFTLSRLGRTDEALAELNRAGSLQPGHAATKVEIGLIQLARNQPAEALASFQSALALKPDFGDAHLGAAKAQVQLGRLDEAVASFEKAAKYSPNDPGVEKAWAESLARAREFDQAAVHYARAVKLAPGDADAHAGYGYMLVFTGRRTEAIREWEEALRLRPGFTGLRDRLESLRRSAGR